MTWARRDLLAASAAVAGGVGALASVALQDDHLLCPAPTAPTWAVDTSDRTAFGFGHWGPPVLDAEHVYTSTGHGVTAGGAGTVAAIDDDTGTVEWVHEQEGSGFGRPRLHEDVLLVPSGKNQLLALHAADGTERWRVDAGNDDPESSSYALETPVVAGEAGVVVQAFVGPSRDWAGGGDALAGIDVQTGAVRWTRNVAGGGIPIRGDGGTVGVVGDDGTVLLLDPSTGRVRWEAMVDGRVERVGDPADGSIVPILTDSDVVRAVDVDAERIAWLGEPVHEGRRDAYPVTKVPGVAVGGGVVASERSDGVVEAYDRTTGTHRFSYDPGAPVRAVAVDARRSQVVAYDGRDVLSILDAETGERTTQIATASTNDGETCGAHVDGYDHPDVAVGDDALYVADGSTRKYEVP